MPTQREKFILCEVMTWSPERREQFRTLRHKNSIVMAHMLAAREAPRCLTDGVLVNGMTAIKDRHDCDHLMKTFRDKGMNVSPNDIYLDEIADSYGDIEAVAGHDSALGVVRRKCEKLSVDTEGIINVKGRGERKVEEKKGKGLHPRIVEEVRSQMLESDPSLKLKDQRELTEAIIDKHGS